MNMNRLAGAALLLAGAALLVSFRPQGAGSDSGPELHVYKTPQCGCCAKWVTHMKAAGFRVTVEDVTEMAAVKRRAGVPYELSSCHTTVAGDYVIGGHVPAPVVRRFLEEAPQVAGISVPGMPIRFSRDGGAGPAAVRRDRLRRRGNRTVFENIDPRGTR